MTNLPTRLSEHLSLGRLPLCVLKSQELLVLGAGIGVRVQKLHPKVLLLFHFRSCDWAADWSLGAPFARQCPPDPR
jgi:hypothetical protein